MKRGACGSSPGFRLSSGPSDAVRILVSTPTFLPTVGGAEMGIHEIYRRIATRHEVVVIAPALVRDLPSTTAVSQEHAAAPYETEQLAGWLSSLPVTAVARAIGRTSVPYALALSRFATRWRPDVVNLHTMWRHTLATEYLSVVRHFPVLLSLARSKDVLETQNAVVRALSRRTIRAATAVSPNSTWYLAKGVSAGRATVIPFGVDTRTFRPATGRTGLREELGVGHSRPLLLSVQRLVPLKRVDVLLDVVAELRRRGRDVTLVIAGEGPERRGLEARAQRLRLGNRARFVGHVSSERLPAYFEAADAFVYHSLSETFGIVFAQAMAAGLPIVAADVSGIPHVVHPENGALIEPFDVAGFADAVLELLRDDELRAAIGRRNRLRAEHEFEWDRIADRYEELLLSLAGARA